MFGEGWSEEELLLDVGDVLEGVETLEEFIVEESFVSVVFVSFLGESWVDGDALLRGG